MHIEPPRPKISADSLFDRAVDRIEDAIGSLPYAWMEFIARCLLIVGVLVTMWTLALILYVLVYRWKLGPVILGVLVVALGAGYMTWENRR